MAQAAKSNSNIIIARTARTFGHLAAASYLLLMLAVGLPIWWRTTEVYRVTLPYAEIDRLAQDLQTRMRAELLLISSEDVKMGPKVQALLKGAIMLCFLGGNVRILYNSLFFAFRFFSVLIFPEQQASFL